MYISNSSLPKHFHMLKIPTFLFSGRALKAMAFSVTFSLESKSFLDLNLHTINTFSLAFNMQDEDQRSQINMEEII